MLFRMVQWTHLGVNKETWDCMGEHSKEIVSGFKAQ